MANIWWMTVAAGGSGRAPRVSSGRLQSIELVQGCHKTVPDPTSGSRLFLNPGRHPANALTLTCKMKGEDAEAVVSHLKTLK